MHIVITVTELGDFLCQKFDTFRRIAGNDTLLIWKISKNACKYLGIQVYTQYDIQACFLKKLLMLSKNFVKIPYYSSYLGL